MIINLHGWAADARIHRHMSQMNRKSDEAGFIAVYPNGTGWPGAWNAGNHLGERNGADDVGFISALIDTLIADYEIDTLMIYAAGFSNGAMMSHRLGCELSDRIAAIGPVAGGLVFPGCQPEKPVPVIAFHARNDPVVRYEGNIIQEIEFHSIQDGLEAWAQINGCDQGPDTTYTEDGRAMCQRWWDADSDMEVILWTTSSGKHTWPGGGAIPFPAVAFPSRAIDANDLMWDFFTKHPLRMVEHPMKNEQDFYINPERN